jgi:hypothetical protein
MWEPGGSYVGATLWRYMGGARQGHRAGFRLRLGHADTGQNRGGLPDAPVEERVTWV